MNMLHLFLCMPLQGHALAYLPKHAWLRWNLLILVYSMRGQTSATAWWRPSTKSIWVPTDSAVKVGSIFAVMCSKSTQHRSLWEETLFVSLKRSLFDAVCKSSNVSSRLFIHMSAAFLLTPLLTVCRVKILAESRVLIMFQVLENYSIISSYIFMCAEHDFTLCKPPLNVFSQAFMESKLEIINNK